MNGSNIVIRVASANGARTLTLKSCAVRGPAGHAGAENATISGNGSMSFYDNGGNLLFTLQLPLYDGASE